MNATRLLGAFLCAALLSSNSPRSAQAASPQTETETEDLLEAAERHQARGDSRAAAEAYRRAFELGRKPSVGLRAARSLVKAGQWVEAAALYREVMSVEVATDAPREDLDANAQATEEHQELLPRIPTVVVFVEGAPANSVHVSIDGRPVLTERLGSRIQVNPGTLRVLGVHGGTTVDTTVELRNGDVKPVMLAFSASNRAAMAAGARAATSSDLRPGVNPGSAVDPGSRAPRLIGFAAMGVGGAALITGGVFGALALGDESQLKSRCPRDVCSNALESDVEAYESKKAIAAVGLTAGAILAGGGAALYFLTTPSASAASASVGMYCAPLGCGVRGVF